MQLSLLAAALARRALGGRSCLGWCNNLQIDTEVLTMLQGYIANEWKGRPRVEPNGQLW